MNSKVSSKCVSALACLGILVLFALLAVVWLQFYAGSFRNTSFRQRTSTGISIPTNYTVSAQILEPRLRPKLKEFRENSYFDSSGLEADIEYIKPMKISPLPLHDHDIIFNEMNNYSNNPIFLHHSGHFRHDMAEVWDPHPNYEIDAFGKIMRLQLAHDNNFIAPNLYITHAIANYTHRIPFNQGLLGCFYTGNVQGDVDSDVVVSLCNGMTGYIRTSDGNYYIEPVEYSNGTMNSFLHRIKKILRTSNRDNEVISADDTFHNCGTNETENEINNEIQEDYPIALNLHNDLHQSFKRNTATNSSTKSDFSSNTSNHIRKKREDDEYFNTEEVVVEDFEENRPLEYFIKVLVVADQTMLEFYRTKDELNHYILTLMSQTARVFKDPSIGNAISVAVIEIRILENQDFQALDSEATLKRFCKWRENYTVHSNHDVALLLTRHDFCKDKNQECTILGMAKVGGMCSRSSCAIVSDKGLPTSYTIAHELGHNLNIPHDDIRGMCVNLNRGQTLKFIMSPLLDEYLKPWMWSPCSKYYVTEFLASKKSKCLLKRPTLNFISTELANIPPGEKYKINQQCEFEFGKGAEQCFPEEEPPCVHLWCTTNPNTGCSTSHMPWAEGTYCGPDSWCHHGECIPFEENDLKPVAGGWGLWSE